MEIELEAHYFRKEKQTKELDCILDHVNDREKPCTVCLGCSWYILLFFHLGNKNILETTMGTLEF